MLPGSVQVDELLLRLRQGDLLALGELFVCYREALKRLVQFRLDRRLWGRVDASDVVQDVYLDAAQRVQHYYGLNFRSSPICCWTCPEPPVLLGL